MTSTSPTPHSGDFDDLDGGLEPALDSSEFDDAARDGDQFDLADRQALRRMPGLSTELADVSIVEYRQLRLERVVLVGVWTEGTAAEAENSMLELRRLAETAGALVLDGFVQRRDKPDPATYVGSGKAKELRDAILAEGADTLICDGELTPSQLSKLEDVVKVKVIDRTALILDIFAQHARSREGKAQVELAQMSYMMPRLRGWGASMSRQGGGQAAGGVGIGGRGPGETKIETDRRRIRTKMAKLRRELAEMGTSRATQRGERRRNEIAAVAIVGYTNAGKSSLLNRITGAGVLVENALFATLDPTVRRAATPDGREYTLTDTVGFVRHLPHQLVEAFRSTLEEISDADLILHIVDGSDPEPEAQLTAVRAVLAEISVRDASERGTSEERERAIRTVRRASEERGRAIRSARDVPEIVVINKADAADPYVLERLVRREPNAVVVSARTGQGIEGLLAAIADAIPRPQVEVDVLFPYDQGHLVSRVHEQGDILTEEHTGEGTRMRARVSAALAAELAPFAAAG